MCVTWGSMKTLVKDDSLFVHEAIKIQAEWEGKNPETAKFSDFPVRSQSAILQRSATLKTEYERETR